MTNQEGSMPDTVEYLYKEYVRLSERCASYVQSSFDDIRLYGAIGSVLAWTPIAKSKLIEEDAQPLALLLGFLGILTVFIILGIYNALKQSLVVYYLTQLGAYEAEIRNRLDLDKQSTFHWTETYSGWRNTRVKEIGVHLLLVIVVVLVIFPTVALAITRHPLYPWLYLGTALVFFSVYLNVARKIFK